MVDGSSNIVLSDAVPVDDPPCADYPATALDPDTGLPVAYYDPDTGWSAVAGGAGGVEVYSGEGDPNTEIGDPGVSQALYYDTAAPGVGAYPPVSPPTSQSCSLWMWDDAAVAWERYPKVIHASVSASAAAAVADATWTAVGIADVENFDTANMHSTSAATGRIYAPYDGIYEVGGRGKWESVSGATAGVRGFRLEKNGTTQVSNSIETHAAGTMAELSLPFYWPGITLAAGDYLRLVVYQNSGGALDFTLRELCLRLVQPT